MRNPTKYLLLTLFAICLFSCEYDRLADSGMDLDLRDFVQRAAPDGRLDHFVLPQSDDFANIPQEPKNPLNTAKVELGKMLFFETGLGVHAEKESGIGTYSCGSCHIPSAGFKPGRSQGIADGGMGIGVNGETRVRNQEYDETEMDAQGIRPLSVINVAFVPNTLWNGQFGSGGVNEGTEDVWDLDPLLEVNHLGYLGPETQNIEGLKLHRMEVNREVVENLGYKDLFDEAFPDFQEEERYSLVTGSFAISAYLRSLTTTEAPFQKWLKGDDYAMTRSEKRGATLFFDKANCYTCHDGTNLGSNRFFALGVNDLFMIPSFNTGPNDSKNLGRGGFTKNPEDLYKFKVPQLYNLKSTPFYFHGSSKRSLEEVVEYFDLAIPENPNVPPEQIANGFQALDLTEQEKVDLVAFLRHSLYDPDLERYAPEDIRSGNCFPNNDSRSRKDLGCE